MDGWWCGAVPPRSCSSGCREAAKWNPTSYPSQPNTQHHTLCQHHPLMHYITHSSQHHSLHHTSQYTCTTTHTLPNTTHSCTTSHYPMQYTSQHHPLMHYNTHSSQHHTLQHTSGAINTSQTYAPANTSFLHTTPTIHAQHNKHTSQHNITQQLQLSTFTEHTELK